MKRKSKKYEPILADDSIVAVGIDTIHTVVGGLEIVGKYDYKNEVGAFKFELSYGWEYSSIKDIEQFIQGEISKKLCPVN